MFFYCWRDRTTHVKQSVKVSIRKQIAEHLQTSLPTPHASEPVMNDGDSRTHFNSGRPLAVAKSCQTGNHWISKNFFIPSRRQRLHLRNSDNGIREL